MKFPWSRRRRNLTDTGSPKLKTQSASRLLDLPAEIRLRIFEHLIHNADMVPEPHLTAANEHGRSHSVGHVSLVHSKETWLSFTIAKPPGFALLAPSILRVSRLIHNEFMDIMYAKILWVINILDLEPSGISAIVGRNPTIIASPERQSIFMRWVSHAYIRQHIRPEENLAQKAQTLQSLLNCLDAKRKSTQVTLHFDSMHLIWDPASPRTKKSESEWMHFEGELRKMDLGPSPHFQVGTYWRESEGLSRFDLLAKSVGGKVNSQSYVYR